MRSTLLSACGTLLLFSCAGGASPTPDSPAAREPTTGAASHQESGAAEGANEFKLKASTTAGSAHGATESKIKATNTHAAMKFFVVDKTKGAPLTGVVISLEGPDGEKFYTEETDAAGYGEVLVPIGKTYEVVYLSLGRKDVTARVTVKNEPRQNIRLTLNYKPRAPEPGPPAAGEGQPTGKTPAFRLDGVTFRSGSTELAPESLPRLDSVVEYMTYKKSARIEIAGHTDNVGPAKTNKALSERRAKACRDYLIRKGIDGSRIEAVGYGDEQPLASNDTEAGRQQNRRIEAREL